MSLFTLRLAMLPQRGGFTLKKPMKRLPAVLVSYVYVKKFIKEQREYNYRDWVLDCGAFTASQSGKEIDLSAYTDFCLERQASDPTLTEVFALDVIGDSEASLRNAEYMTEQGVRCIPTYHQFEPEEALIEIAKRYDKIAIGGVARSKTASIERFIERVFSLVWPKKIHGFGITRRSFLLAFPFHSVDSSTWDLGPHAFNSWKSYTGNASRLAWTGAHHKDLRSEVDHYLKLEDEVSWRWRKKLSSLDDVKEHG